MKSPRIATVLNFVLPGAGFLYLGRIWFAVANFVLAIGIPVLWTVGTKDGTDFLHYIALAIAAGSAGFAHSVAVRQQNSNSSSRPSDPNDDSESSLNPSL